MSEDKSLKVFIWKYKTVIITACLIILLVLSFYLGQIYERQEILNKFYCFAK